MPTKRLTHEQKIASKLAATRKGRVTLVKARNLNPITVGSKLRRATEVTIIPDSELDTLKIDHTYQRPENRDLVNELVAVLEAGGMVPDPITVAVRPDKSRWIVDGQQRWAAHYLANKPIAAVLYYVETLDEERRLFSVLNTYRRPNPAMRMRAWTGPSRELVEWMGSNVASPICSELSFGSGGSVRYKAATILRGVGAVLGISPGSGSSTVTENFMRALDRVYGADRKRAIRLTQAYLNLMKTLFPQQVQHNHAVALGMAAAERWANGDCKMPSGKVLYNLKRLNWTNNSMERRLWLPFLKAEVLRRWPKS